MTKALLQAFEQMGAEWESSSCPVCHADKWKRFPFCRLCSITLQRAHIFFSMEPDEALALAGELKREVAFFNKLEKLRHDKSLRSRRARTALIRRHYRARAKREKRRNSRKK